MPCSGRERLRRTSRTQVSARMESPGKTGAGNFTSVKPRLATVVFSVVSATVSPTSRPRVKRLLTMGRPYSLRAAAWASMCSGWGFSVRQENQMLSASVMVRVTSWAKWRPTVKSSK